MPSAPEIVNQLLPNLWIFIAHTLATISLLVILSKLVYQPFKKAMRTRREGIKKILLDANEKNDSAKKEYLENSRILQQTKNNVDKIIKTAQDEADSDRTKIISTAKKEAEEIRYTAKQNIYSDNLKNQEKIKETIGITAVEIASKIIEKKLQTKDHKDIIDKFINDVDLIGDDFDEE